MQAGPQIPVAVLRSDLFPLGVGLVATIAGLAAGILFFVRRRERDRPLLYFGLMASMYGLRVLANTDTAGYLVPRGVQLWLIWFVTGFILIPFVLFFGNLLTPARRRQRLWGLGVLVLLGTVYTLAHLFPSARNAADRTNEIMVLIALPVLFVLLRRPATRELWVVRFGVLCLLCFATYTNFVSLGWIAGKAHIEYVGFTILLGCVGWVAVRRSIESEERLDAIHREMELAQRIQSRLLPGDVAMKGVDIATRYVPVAWVAGDFYDFLLRGDEGIGILIADVSGHGVPAALAASMVKIAIRSQIDNAGDPAAVLRGMNEILLGNMDLQFVTAAYLYLDLAGRELRYAGAGHPAMLVWHAADRRAEPVEENGLILGMFPDCEYKTRRMPLSAGDRCLLYTDGISEAPNPAGEEFGEKRLMEFFTDHAAAAPGEFCDALLAQVEAWCGRRAGKEQPDDLTVLMVEFTG
jgi:phosphoserine phosphatase RsbU/P